VSYSVDKRLARVTVGRAARPLDAPAAALPTPRRANVYFARIHHSLTVHGEVYAEQEVFLSPVVTVFLSKGRKILK
jgi:hypothetical protein